MKIYLYDSNGIYLHEVEACEGIIYKNATTIKPTFENIDDNKCIARFNKYLNVWEYDYNYDYINRKAKELGLELKPLNSMTDSDMKNVKLY